MAGKQPKRRISVAKKPSKYQIRRATMRDLPSLAQLFDAYRVFYRQTSSVAAAKAFLQKRLRERSSVIFVAQRPDGTLCGFTQLYPLFSSVRMTPVWILNDLYVHPIARRSGVANLLMAAAEEFGQRSRAGYLMLQTEKKNKHAQALYVARKWKVDRDCFYFYLSF